MDLNFEISLRLAAFAEHLPVAGFRINQWGQINGVKSMGSELLIDGSGLIFLRFSITTTL